MIHLSKRECIVQGHLEETEETVLNGMKEPKRVQSLCDIRLVDIEQLKSTLTLEILVSKKNCEFCLYGKYKFFPVIVCLFGYFYFILFLCLVQLNVKLYFNLIL